MTEKCRIEMLQKMISCETVSVKGSYDDTEFARLRQVMEEAFPLVHKRCERRIFGEDCWIYRLPGKDRNRHVMLMSHHDVAAVTGEWKYGAFSGTVAGGKIWGRGTVDTKTPLFAEFEALETLLEQGYEPPCNLYIGSSHNEEIGGNGILLAKEYFQEQGICFDVILDEGGGVTDPPLGKMSCKKCAMVAVHEKGCHALECSAEVLPGHSSLAGKSAAPVDRMAAFIAEANRGDLFIRRFSPQTRAMFRHLAPYTGFPMKLILSNLWCFGGVLKKLLPKMNAQAAGMTGTTCGFTEINGSNDLHKCTAKALLRSVDAGDVKKDLAAFYALAEKYEIQVEEAEAGEDPIPANMDSPLFAYTKECIKDVFPACPAVPFILPAGTDARHLTDICGCVLRFAPIRLSAQQLASVHGTDENIDVEAVEDCVRFYRRFLGNLRFEQ